MPLGCDYFYARTFLLMQTLPLIDIRPLTQQSNKGVAAQIGQACREVGFNNVGLIAQPKRSPQQGT